MQFIVSVFSEIPFNPTYGLNGISIAVTIRSLDRIEGFTIALAIRSVDPTRTTGN